MCNPPIAYGCNLRERTFLPKVTYGFFSGKITSAAELLSLKYQVER
jgi:hypothetical protein